MSLWKYLIQTSTGASSPESWGYIIFEMRYGVGLAGPASAPPQGMAPKEARQSEGREAQSEAQGSRSCLGVPWSCDNEARAVGFSGSREPPEKLRMKWVPTPQPQHPYPLLPHPHLPPPRAGSSLGQGEGRGEDGPLVRSLWLAGSAGLELGLVVAVAESTERPSTGDETVAL